MSESILVRTLLIKTISQAHKAAQVNFDDEAPMACITFANWSYLVY